jgi:hypothetical protein
LHRYISRLPYRSPKYQSHVDRDVTSNDTPTPRKCLILDFESGKDLFRRGTKNGEMGVI